MRKVVLSLLILFTFVGSAFAQSSWTIMVFMNADNNLELAAISDFVEMVLAPISGSGLNIVVQLDRIPGYVSSIEGVCDDWTGTLRFALSHLMAPYSVSAVQDLGEVNMGSPEALIDFVSWAMDNYPAQHYALIIWDHGDGWRYGGDRFSQSWKTAGYDETSNDYLYMDELQTALRILRDRGYKIDLIGFDACLMGMIEVAYELKDFASYMVASEDLVPGEGWKYDVFLSTLVSMLDQGIDVSPEDLGRLIIRSYRETTGNTLSLIDLRRMDDLSSLLRELSSRLKNDVSLARFARSQVIRFYDPSIIDLYSFCASIAGLRSSSISELASALCDAIGSAVIENYSKVEGAHGLSIYFPDRGEGSYERFYDDPRHDFSAYTEWNSFLKSYLRETRDDKSSSWGKIDVDGVLSESEVKDATLLNPSDADSFKIYVKNDEANLYIGISVQTDVSLDLGDSIIMYIDSDGDGSFPDSRDSSDGMLKIFYDGSRWLAYFYPLWYDYSQYRVRSLDPLQCPEVEVKGGISAGGNLEVEIRIPFGNYRFPFKAGSSLGYYIQIYDAGTSSFIGEYPSIGSMGSSEQIPTIYTPPRLEPLMYGGIKLAAKGGGDDDDEFVLSSGCSSTGGGSVSLILISLGWLFAFGVRKR